MPSRLHISIWVGFNVALWFFLLWMQGTPLSALEYLKPFGVSVTINVIVGKLVNSFLWAWPLLNRWVLKCPDLRGTWMLTMQSSWTEPNTNKEVPPIKGFVTVRQTFTSLSFRVMTKESISKLTSYRIIEQEDGFFQLSAVYRNEPKIMLQGDRSEIHYGAIMLRIHGQPVIALDGHYWTDRKTRGSMMLMDRRKNICNTYEEALVLFSNEA